MQRSHDKEDHYAGTIERAACSLVFKQRQDAPETFQRGRVSLSGCFKLGYTHQTQAVANTHAADSPPEATKTVRLVCFMKLARLFDPSADM